MKKINFNSENVKIERVYQTMPRDQIPWHRESPPLELVDLVKSGKISPCRTIELGCGLGSAALFLASNGFDVLGVDASSAAIDHARADAESRGIECRFQRMNILTDLENIPNQFEFALDWEVFHHIDPSDRPRYLAAVKRLLRPGGRYLSTGFSREDEHFGTGPYRKTPLGTMLYFSSEDELRELFSRYFSILELKPIQIPGKTTPHSAIFCLMEK
jgi:2-polyprenyl-3-methyl-5-hydroxy-6-metoxy-1,4-benzoquinol methylase